MIRLTPTGIELEGDDKHVGLLEEEWGMTNCNPVPTPYVKPVGSRASGPCAGEVAGAGSITFEERELSIDFFKKRVEKADRSRFDICEVFSPPRVCVVASDHGLRAGWSLDV